MAARATNFILMVGVGIACAALHSMMDAGLCIGQLCVLVMCMDLLRKGDRCPRFLIRILGIACLYAG